MEMISIWEIDIFKGFFGGSPVFVWVHLQGDSVFGPQLLLLESSCPWTKSLHSAFIYHNLSVRLYIIQCCMLSHVNSSKYFLVWYWYAQSCLTQNESVSDLFKAHLTNSKQPQSMAQCVREQKAFLEKQLLTLKKLLQ